VTDPNQLAQEWKYYVTDHNKLGRE